MKKCVHLLAWATLAVVSVTSKPIVVGRQEDSPPATQGPWGTCAAFYSYSPPASTDFVIDKVAGVPGRVPRSVKRNH